MAENELNLRLKVNDDGTVVMDKFAQSIKNVEKNAQGMSQALNVIRYDALVNLGQKAMNVASQFKEMAEAGAKVQSIQDSFTLMGKNSGVAIDDLISKLKQATNETIDDSDLMRKSTRLMAEGFSSNQLVQVGEAARVAARLMGTDVREAYDQVADSIVNLRERGLKTAGFVIDLNEAYEKQAVKLHVAATDLNDYGKQMAMMDAVYQKSIELHDKLGMSMETESEKFQKLNAQWKQFQEGIGGLALEAWKELQSYIGSTYVGVISLFNLLDRIKGQSVPYPGEEEHGQAGRAAALIAGKSQVKTVSEDERWKKVLEKNKEYFQSLEKMTSLEMNVATVESATTSVLSDRYKVMDELDKKLKELQISEAQEADYSAKGIAEATIAANELTTERLRLSAKEAAQGKSEWVEEYAQTPNTLVQQLRMMESTWENLGNTISSSWSTNFSSMIKGTESFADGVKNIFTGMGDAIINTITKMAANWLMFGSLTGEKNGTSFFGTSSGGYGGLLGGIGSILGLAEGGIFSSPTAAIVGDNGPEAVIPLKNGKVPIEGGGGGGDVYIVNYNQVTDPNTFVKIYGPIVKKLSDQSAAEAKRFRPGAK